MILMGCIGLGWYAASRYATRIKVLEEMEQVLEYLYGEIAYAGCDLLELLQELGRRGNYFQNFWKDLGNVLQKRAGGTFGEHWRTILRKQNFYTMLREEDRELFLEIGNNVGNLDRQTQLHTLKIFQERLLAIRKTARKEYKDRAKVTGITAVTAGMFLSILLL